MQADDDPPPPPPGGARASVRPRGRRSSASAALSSKTGLPVPKNVSDFLDEIEELLRDSQGSSEDIGVVEDLLDEYDRVRDELGAHIDAARRELHKSEDRHELMAHPGGWADVEARVGVFALDYLREWASAELPEGVSAGSTCDVTMPSGIKTQVEIPEGMGPGGKLEVVFERQPKRFQVDALKALLEGRDVILAVPCGAGKTCPPAMFAAQKAWEALGPEQGPCFSVWICPTVLLVKAKVRDLNGRYDMWPVEGGGAAFAVAVDGRGKKRDRDGVVCYESGLPEAPTTSYRHPVLQQLQDMDIVVGALVMTPEMFKLCHSWICLQAQQGHVSCFVIDEADDETGVVDSYRRDQARQGELVRAAVDVANFGREEKLCIPVVALSGTVPRGDVSRLITRALR